MKITTNITLLFLCFYLPQFGFARITTNANDPDVKSKCADGTYSTSVGRGTCSHHGGVVYDDASAKRKSNKIPKIKQPNTEQPKNFPNRVRCIDGTSSKAGRGACSRHGGVAT